MRMMQTSKICALILGGLLPAISLAQPLLTGEVYSLKAQDIVVPLTTDWKASISMMVEEGQQVHQGQIVFVSPPYCPAKKSRTKAIYYIGLKR